MDALTLAQQLMDVIRRANLDRDRVRQALAITDAILADEALAEIVERYASVSA